MVTFLGKEAQSPRKINMSKPETYTAFVIQAHMGETPQMTLSDVCTVEIIADDVDSAIEKAKKLVKKDHYRVKAIIENFVK
jgi:hypothetical protein